MFDFDLKARTLAELDGFQQLGEETSATIVDIAPQKTLKVFSGGAWDRVLTRSNLTAGYAVVPNCLFFGRYTGNGIDNMRSGIGHRIYDGGQFICSRDGYFVPDMLVAGSCLPSFLKKNPEQAVWRLKCEDDFNREDGDDFVFMGAYHSHFGHCLVESMTRLWYVMHLSDSEKQKKKFVFFQGWGIDGGPVAEMLPWLGIPSENILVCRDNIFFKKLTIPSFAWRPWNDWDILLSKEFYRPFSYIRDMAMRSASVDLVDKRIFLTRSRLARSGLHYNNRELSAAQSEALENDAVKRGFKIVAPEALSLANQIALVGNASHIAGPGGSAHHLAAFAYEAQAQIILTHEGFWMGGNDSVFAWDKALKLCYVFGNKEGDAGETPLTAPWNLNLPDWDAAANYCGL